MFLRKTTYTTLIFLAILNFILWGMRLNFQNEELRIIFLNVGQGDAILLTQGENQILIDGGKNEEKLLEGLGKFMPFWDRKIEVVLATHPDQDHIGGLSKLPQKYEIKSLIYTNAKSASNVFKIFEESFSSESIQKVEGRFGVKVKIGKGELELLYPFASLDKKVYKNTNGTSIVGKFTMGEKSFLLTGDMTEKEEKLLIEKNIAVKAQFLKVGHHGSKHSTSQIFLQKVNPSWGIISVGKENRYGHPAKEVLEKLKNFGIRIARTDREGHIVFVCSESSSCQRENL